MAYKIGDFHVGDKVRITNKRGASWNRYGKKDKWMGKTMTIRHIDYSSGYMKMVEDKNERYDGCGWSWYVSDVAEILPKKQPAIVITSDGKTTTAVKRLGRTVLATATAVCGENDTFDFEKGAEIAFQRLKGWELKSDEGDGLVFVRNKKETEPKGFCGKMVCVRASAGYTVGKIYTFVNGKTKDDDGSIRPGGYKIYSPNDVYLTCNFIPLVE